jgi:hypothetical protein
MFKALLDAESDTWSTVITHGDREETCANFPAGIQLVRLHPHKTDNGVTLTLDGETIGHLPADLLYFHRPVSRFIGTGALMYAECKVEYFGDRPELVIPYIDRQGLERWVSQQVSAQRHHIALKRRLGKMPLHRRQRESIAA